MLRPDNALLLGGLYAKNVIVKNSKVVYHGGPLKLDNVYFVNCTFEIFHQTPGLTLLKPLRTPSVTFDTA
jgi:hypothetical protein